MSDENTPKLVTDPAHINGDLEHLLAHPPQVSPNGYYNRYHRAPGESARNDPPMGSALNGTTPDGTPWRDFLATRPKRAAPPLPADAPGLKGIRAVLVANDDGPKYMLPLFIRSLRTLLPPSLTGDADHPSRIFFSVPRDGQPGEARSSRMYHNTLAEPVGKHGLVVHSRPIDTLRWGVDWLDTQHGIKPEEILYFAGPNYGHNADGVRSASGTMGILNEAMRQGAHIAVALHAANPLDDISHNANLYSFASNQDLVQVILAQLLSHPWPDPVFVSINTPPARANGVELAVPNNGSPHRLFCDRVITGSALNQKLGGQAYPDGAFIGMQRWQGYEGPANPSPDDHSELAAMARGHISLTIEAFDKTRTDPQSHTANVAAFNAQLQQAMASHLAATAGAGLAAVAQAEPPVHRTP